MTDLSSKIKSAARRELFEGITRILDTIAEQTITKPRKAWDEFDLRAKECPLPSYSLRHPTEPRLVGGINFSHEEDDEIFVLLGDEQNMTVLRRAAEKILQEDDIKRHHKPAALPEEDERPEEDESRFHIKSKTILTLLGKRGNHLAETESENISFEVTFILDIEYAYEEEKWGDPSNSSLAGAASAS